MSKVLQVAWREFFVTVSSKAFLLGLLLLPVLGTLFAMLIPRLFDLGDFDVRGEVAIVDPDGRVLAALREALDSATVAERQRAAAERVREQMPPAARNFVDPEMLARLSAQLTLVERPADSDLEQEKAWLYAPSETRHLALIVVDENAVEPEPGSTDYGAYALYVSPNLDDRVESQIRAALREAIVTARIEARGLDPEAIRALVNVPRVRAVTVTADDERSSVGAFNVMLPLAFGALLFIGVMTGGQALLTSTVEEKSSRVMEVLLSAVSPMQLMAGKILGHMAVSVVALGLYVAMGLAMLAGFTLLGLLDFSLILYLGIFFVITYLILGSLMMAIGAAVNEMREAQTLMMPVTVLMIVPWVLWMPISRDPDSTLSVALSFIPPINGFAMLLRLASLSPPPAWQVWLSIGIGIASVFAAIWFAAKVFRIGLLMHGKPPSFVTLLRWARAA